MFYAKTRRAEIVDNNQEKNGVDIVSAIKSEYQTGCRSYWNSKGMDDNLEEIVRHARGCASLFFSGDNAYLAILAATGNQVDVRSYNSIEQAVEALQ